LSRTPQTTEPLEKQTENEKQSDPDIHDNFLEINFVTCNSNAINPKEFVRYDLDEPDIPLKPQVRLSEDAEVNIADEQAKDPELNRIIHQIRQGNAKKSISDKHLIVDDVLYYLSNADNDPAIRLYICADSLSNTCR
jgi:hypothetical protein